MNIYISDELHNECLDLVSRISKQAKLYLVGCGKKNKVWTTLIPLIKHGGCDVTPGVHPDEIAKKLIILQKRKLNFAGFIRLTWRSKTKWKDDESGPDMSYNKNTIFVTYTNIQNTLPTAEYMNDSSRQVEATIAIVPKNYKPKGSAPL